MTRDDIFKLAEKAGFHLSSIYLECGRIWWSDECPLDEELLRFAALVAEAEREACKDLWEAQKLTDQQISDHIEAAVAAKRKPLSDDEILDVCMVCAIRPDSDPITLAFARAIERAHGIGSEE